MHDIVVIGASAGGVEALKKISADLSPDLDAAIFVVVHISPDSSGLLPNILNRNSKIPAHQAQEGEAIRPGRIYVAPPDRHLLLERDEVRVVNGPRHNRHRPAIDLLFRTAARHFGERVVGVVLTGFLDDGSSGLLAIHNAGGATIVQSPDDAEVASMPKNALEQVQPDYCVPLAEIAGIINRLAGVEAVPMARRSNHKKKPEKKRAQTPITCPECHGTIWEVEENGEIRFECRVGHSYSPEAMFQANDEDVERSLWAALRSLEESAALEHRLAEMAEKRSRSLAHKRFAEKARERMQHAAVLREMLVGSRRRKSAAEGIDKGPTTEELQEVS